MKTLIIVLTFCFSMSWLNAQSLLDTTDTDQMDYSFVQQSAPEQADEVLKIKKFDTHLQVGTSFLFSPRNFYGPSYFVAPSLTYNVNKRLSFSAGIGLQQTHLYPLNSNEIAGENGIRNVNTYLFARGDYLITPRLKFGAMAYKSINQGPGYGAYQYPYNLNYQGVSFDLQYKLSKSFSVGFEMRMQDYSLPAINSNDLIYPMEFVPGSGF